MSTQQQALVMETLVSLKKALKRNAYDSDSDSPIDKPTNRGNKLRKRARFVRQGRLESTGGPAAHREVVEHAGYQRAVISRNPPLVDEDGYDLDSEDDDEHIQEVEAAAAEANPYSSIHLEQIFAPLTSTTDLPTHPVLSRPFTSKALDELASQACALSHKENRVLRKVKPLLTRLHGDSPWVPCGVMVTDDDRDLFVHTERYLQQAVRGGARIDSARPVINGNGAQIPRLELPFEEASQGNKAIEKEAHDVQMEDAENKDDSNAAKVNGAKPRLEIEDKSLDKVEASGEAGNNATGRDTNGAFAGSGSTQENVAVTNGDEAQPATNKEGDIEMADAAASGGGRPTIASQADVNGTLLPTQDTVEELFIHPLFLAPQSSKLDRDLGLPEQESEDIRRLLQLYVQKQEEICRGTSKLYQGLLKADRYRNTVLRWAKAEAHCGPNRDMSDGEDWYDKEEWGLTEDLKKGQDEEEEDTVQTQKKTRNRK